MEGKQIDILEFEKYFYDYFEMLHHYAYTIVRDSDDAKDLVQVAFLKLWTRHRNLQISHSIRAYLYRAVYNLSLNHIRDTQVRRRHVSPAVQHGDPQHAAGPLFEKEFAGALAREIDKLPTQCRTVFLKSRIEEKKNAEIASELGVSVKAVEAQMTRALRILRHNLGEYISYAGLLFLYNETFFNGY